MKTARWSAIVLLGFLGLSAFAGGIPMILDPSGKIMKMPVELLRYTPFHSFLVPGIILLCANGLLAFAILALALRRTPGYGFWTAFQGCVLFTWLAVECWMLRLVVWPHWLYGAVAALLICAGAVLWRNESRTAPVPAERL